MSPVYFNTVKNKIKKSAIIITPAKPLCRATYLRHHWHDSAVYLLRRLRAWEGNSRESGSTESLWKEAKLFLNEPYCKYESKQSKIKSILWTMLIMLYQIYLQIVGLKETLNNIISVFLFDSFAFLPRTSFPFFLLTWSL